MLDKRLTTVYEMAEGKIICDIGSDHAKLPVFCVLTGKAEYAYACDIRTGPLSAARLTIESNGVSDRVETILSDGFLDIPDDVFEKIDCFVIAGMGGELIANIISKRLTKKKMVLQPQSAVPELCEYLADNGYYIKERRYAQQSGKLYTAFLVEYDGKKRAPTLFENSVRSPEFYKYTELEKKRAEKAIEGILASEKSDKTRLGYFEKILEEINSL